MSADSSRGFQSVLSACMEKFLQAVDALKPRAVSPLRHLIMPEVFRLLHGCGFRIGEVLKLRVRDVDLNQGIITVRQGKFRKDRLVPPALPLVNRLRKYAAHFEKRSPDAIFFPRPHARADRHMKPTDFSVHVTRFLTNYLAAQRNVSPNTIKAYRDAFTLLLRFCRDVQEIAPEKLRLEQIDVSLVEAFLDHLERERKSSPRTRNQRLAALHAFFRYVQTEEPTRMHQCQKILVIPLRKHARPTVAYLSKEELAEILAQPNLRTPEDREEAVLLSLLYPTHPPIPYHHDFSLQ